MAKTIEKDGKLVLASDFETKNLDPNYYKKANTGGKEIFYFDKILNTDALTIRIVNPSIKETQDKLTGEDGTGSPSKVAIGTPKTVITGVYRDDFFINVQNSWQSGGGGMLKTLVDTAAGFITSRDFKFFNGLAGEVLDKVPESWKNTEIFKQVQGMQQEAVKYSNSHIFTAEDYFKSFKGTNITLPMNLSINLLTDTYQGGEGFRDIKEIVAELYNISVGDFSSIYNYVGIQNAPNGFSSTFLNLESPLIPGSLYIYFGDTENGGFLVKNMLISSVAATMSKTMVDVSPPPIMGTNVNDYSGGSVFKPLYIDVQITFEPARMMSKNDMWEILGLPNRTES